MSEIPGGPILLLVFVLTWQKELLSIVPAKKQ